MQALMLLDRPDLEAFLLAFGQSLLNISTELYLIIKEVIGLKLFIIIFYLLWIEKQRYVSEAAKLGILHKDNAHIIAPKTVLQCFIYDDLVKQYFIRCPNFDSVIKSAC